jgi:rod shape-determining protein MreD
MADRDLTANRWVYGLAYFGVMSVIILFHILPIEIGPNGYPGPDLLLCITFAWVLRRPQYVPTPLIALVFLAADMLFLRPPGLWTALVVLGVEFLRAREATSRELPFLVEWGVVSVVLIAITVANRLVLSVFMVAQAGFGLTLLQLVATILAYPLIVLASRMVFNVRKMTPGEIDAAGRPR